MEDLSIHQMIEITEMLDLALELKEIEDNMTDSGFCCQGDIEYLETASERLAKLKNKYTVPK